MCVRVRNKGNLIKHNNFQRVSCPYVIRNVVAVDIN